MAGDVVELILADHRHFESLLRRLRDSTDDRMSARAELAASLVAHAMAEETKVYPRLRRRDTIDEEEAEHGREEHDEGHEALLSLLEVEDLQSEAFHDAVETLTEAVTHHLDEEERTVLDPARSDVPEDGLQSLGVAFMEERQRQLDADCGAIDNVRRLVENTRDDVPPLT